jgi:hypothetical protein
MSGTNVIIEVDQRIKRIPFATRYDRLLLWPQRIHTGPCPPQIRGETGPVPTISRKLAVARKYEWSLRGQDRLCQALGVREADVFPLRYALRVPIRDERETRAGVLG